MAKVYPSIDGRLRDFIADQSMFFVATAPTGGDGHINISPKGMRGTFAILDEHRVGYLDYTGSGAETIAHLQENGRIVVMFCAFTGPPNIVRLHGRGTAVLLGEASFDELAARFEVADQHGVRAVIVVEVDRVSDSCGFSVPLLDYVADRDLLISNLSRKDDRALVDYWATRNVTSIDGLPAIPLPPDPAAAATTVSAAAAATVSAAATVGGSVPSPGPGVGAEPGPIASSPEAVALPTS